MYRNRQLVFFISDGRFDSAKRNELGKLIRRAIEHKQFVVLLIVEDVAGESILETKQVSFRKGKMNVLDYMENYPFPFYIVLKDMQTLPHVLAEALRQWFQIMKQE